MVRKRGSQNSGFGSGVKWFVIPITAATVCLLALLLTSYIMGVIAYPNGGGGLVNLRGVAESATIFAWPTFAFMALMLVHIGTGFTEELGHGICTTYNACVWYRPASADGAAASEGVQFRLFLLDESGNHLERCADFP